jgi:hypothetical protein
MWCAMGNSHAFACAGHQTSPCRPLSTRRELIRRHERVCTTHHPAFVPPRDSTRRPDRRWTRSERYLAPLDLASIKLVRRASVRILPEAAWREICAALFSLDNVSSQFMKVCAIVLTSPTMIPNSSANFDASLLFSKSSIAAIHRFRTLSAFS